MCGLNFIFTDIEMEVFTCTSDLTNKKPVKSGTLYYKGSFGMAMVFTPFELSSAYKNELVKDAVTCTI